MVIWKLKSHGTVIGVIVIEVESKLVGKGNVDGSGVGVDNQTQIFQEHPKETDMLCAENLRLKDKLCLQW
jgi:hypothetical protein